MTMETTTDRPQIRRGAVQRSDDRRLRLGPHSAAIDAGAIGWAISGRSREGRFLRAYEAMLVEHCGGAPSRVEMEMIRRCSRLALHLELMDERFLEDEVMSDFASRQYLAWSGSLMRALRLLGLTRPPQRRGPTLADIVGTSAKTP